MSITKHRIHLSIVSAVAAASLGSVLHAADRTWIGGNSTWTDGGSALLWNPNDEPDSDDRALFILPNTVGLGSNNTINGLDISAAAALNFNGFQLSVSGGATTLSNNATVNLNSAATLIAADITMTTGALITMGTGSTLSAANMSLSDSTIVVANDASVNTDSLVLTNGSLLQLNAGGTVSVVAVAGVGSLTLASNSTLTGQGTYSNGDVFTGITSVLVNDGTISASATGLVVVPPSGTLTLNASSADARVDLDGLGGNGVVNVSRNQTLDINIPLLDVFDGDINLFQNSTLDISAAWTLGAGTIDVSNGGGFFPLTPGVARIAGGAFTQTGGTITVATGDSTLHFNSPFSMTGGTLANTGLVVFNANSTIGSGGNFLMNGSNASITVASGVTVTVNQANFNPDGSGFLSNVVTVESGGQLNLNVGAGADVDFQGTLRLNGGSLAFNNTANAWSIIGNVEVGANTVNSSITGDSITFSGGLVTVGSNSGFSVLSNTTTWNGASLSVQGGAIATLNNATFNGGSFTGQGTLVLNGNAVYGANTTFNVANLNWDGSLVNNLHTIAAGVTLTINSDIGDPMDDRVTINGSSGQLVVNSQPGNAWTMSANLITNPLAVGTALIGGNAQMIFTGATWSVMGNTTASAAMTLGAGSTVTLSAGAFLNANNNVTYAGTVMNGNGTYNPSTLLNTVAPGLTTITTGGFNFDRGNWLIESGGTLSVSTVDYDHDGGVPKAFDATITLNSGRVVFNSGDPAFVMNGTLNMNNTGVIPFWSGEAIEIGDDAGGKAFVNVGGAGQSQFGSLVRFYSDASVTVGAGAHLAFLDGVEFYPVNGTATGTFTGVGTLSTSDTMTFYEATHLNMVGGTVDLDGSDTSGFDVGVFAPVTINAATMLSFGHVNSVGFNRIVVDNLNFLRTGTLNVTLDNPAAEWTINGPGYLALLNGTTTATLLSGSPLNMNGTMNVEGDVTTNARLDIGGTVIIGTIDEPLRLNGGNSTTDPNTLVGGVITGPGILGANSARALRGFGTIQTNVDFDGTAELSADDGTLTITGIIVDAGTLGTNDNDGVLHIPGSWNSNTVTNVLLRGGSLTGGLITVANTNGISGWGTVQSRVLNDTRLNANVAGQTLVFQTALNDNDWDGTLNTGLLQATGGGTLELRDNALFTYQSITNVLSGSTLSINGFSWSFGTASTTTLASGVIKSTTSMSFRGDLTVNAGADSEVQVAAGQVLTFVSTSVTNLNGNLRLNNNNINIDAGATFAGAGALIILNGSSALPDVGAVANVLVDNRGLIRPGGGAVGTFTVKDFQQAATGNVRFQLGGTLLNQYDRLVATGVSVLNGTASLEYTGGFAPALGNSFVILSSSGGVSGTFATIDPPAPLGLLNFVFTPTYNPTNVTLTVTKAYYEIQNGPYPQNFTGNGYELWKTTANTATVTGSSTITGPAIAWAGKLIVASPTGLGLGGVEIKPGAEIELANSAQAVKHPSLSITGAPNAWTGQLDLTTAAFILQTSGGANKTAAILQLSNQIAQGRNGGLWNGQGITSSTIPTTPNTSLALADNADLGLAVFRGQNVDANSLIMVQARLGDATLDGKVDAFDLNRLAANWQQAGKLWSSGDFTGDGKVDAFDLNQLAANWQFGVPGSLEAGLSFFDALAASPLAGVAAAVPEPASLACLAGALPLLAMRRRRAR